ncbi:Imm50 family immunity protein [Pedobacter flavus]|uniref:Imm50 family immunity protein n=1 Tax=Pedobacter flavus TaxID=3113906 RepID=A0ABU7H2N8_9SPHI|nr:Imm50 family immunity protein [Pedobacter sp. VNH31]MEE1885598.1 Imm50 family immunity protein [Pedobacter sp. VNH31]
MWLTLVNNNIAVSSIYKEIIPSLKGIFIHEFNFITGPVFSILLKFDLSELPIDIPAEWNETDYNTVQLQMEFYEIKLDTFDLNPSNYKNGHLLIENLFDHKLITYIDSAGSLVFRFTCSEIFVKSLSGYLNK